MTEVDLACPHRARHAVLYPEEHLVEIKCDRKFCGAGPGRVVLHRWNTQTGEPLETLRLSEPPRRKELRNGTGN